MKVSDLIQRLERLPQDMEVTIVDGFNGGGQPRTINFGPHVETWDSNKHCSDRHDFSDINASEGQDIVTMGYGCY